MHLRNHTSSRDQAGRDGAAAARSVAPLERRRARRRTSSGRAAPWCCRIVEDAADDDASVDVQYRLVRAVDAESAYERALALGKRERHSYKNCDGNTCEWLFAGLEDLRLVDDQELGHGAEVYGFIEKGSASERVVPKDELTEFRSRPAAD